MRHSLKIVLFLFLITSYTAFGGICEDTLKSNQIGRMGFFDLNVGISSASSRGKIHRANSTFNNYAFGLSTRMQSSFIGNYLSNREKKVRFGDVLAAELAIGHIHQGVSKTNDFWLAYSFEFGLGTIATLNKKMDLGLTLTLLKFVRDRVSPNVSGSNILVKARYGKAIAEAGIESRRDRIFGWLTNLLTDSPFPIQYTFSGRYLINNNRNIGARLEFASTSKDYILGDKNYKGWWTMRFFYGLYF